MRRSAAQRFSRRREVTGLAGHEDGNAIVEFLVLGVLMLVPLAYLVIIVGRLQAGVFAAEGAARDAARAVASSPDEDVAAARLRTLAVLAARDQGFADSAVRTDVRCSAQPCLTPEGSVTVTVELDVALPGVPAFVDAVVPAHVPVRAQGRAVVDGLRG